MNGPDRADVRDLLVRFGPSGLSTATHVRDGLAAPVSLTTADQLRGEVVAARIARQGTDWALVADGIWTSRLANGAELTALTRAAIEALASSARVLGPGEPILTPAQLDAVVAALPGAVARATRRPTVQLQTVEYVMARRVLRSRTVTRDRHGDHWWAPKLGDPVRGGGEVPPPPDPARPGGRLLDRWRPQGQRLTVEVVRDWCTTAGVVQVGERPDWEEVVAELLALVAPSP